MKRQANYFAVIPSKVRYNKNLTTRAKIIFCELTALCDEQGQVFESNDVISERYKLSGRTISKSIVELEKAKLIDISKTNEFERVIKIIDYPTSVFGGVKVE